MTYVSRAGQSNGPSYDVVSISAAGVVSMTAPQTDAFSNGQYFTYTVRVVDSTGDYSERDVLLTVTNTNIPPVIHGLSSTPIPSPPVSPRPSTSPPTTRTAARRSASRSPPAPRPGCR